MLRQSACLKHITQVHYRIRLNAQKFIERWTAQVCINEKYSFPKTRKFQGQIC